MGLPAPEWHQGCAWPGNSPSKQGGGTKHIPSSVSCGKQTPWQGHSWLTWHGQDRRGDVGFLVELGVIPEPVDLHRLRRSHSLARQVEGAVPGDVQLLRLTDEVRETCTDTGKQEVHREAKDSPFLAPSSRSLSRDTAPQLLQLTFQPHQDGIGHHLHARDVEFADVGAVIRALGTEDAAGQNGHRLRACGFPFFQEPALRASLIPTCSGRPAALT